MLVGVDGAPAASGEGDHGWRRPGRFGAFISPLLTGLAKRFVDQTGERLGFFGTSTSRRMRLQGRIGYTGWVSGQAHMKQQADQYESDQQELNWLRVLDAAERSQVDHRIPQQLHHIVPLLNAFKSEQQPLELVFPRKGPFDTYPQRMDGFVEEAFASTLDSLSVARILFDIGDQACVKNALAIVRRIKAAIEVEVGAFEVYSCLFGHLFQRFQALRKQEHVGLIDGCHGNRR